MVTCPNGHANPDHQQYCGQCGAPLALPSQPPHASWPPAYRPYPPGQSRRRLSRWLLITAVSVAVVAAVAALTVWLTNRRTDSDRWSAYPHTMGCTVDTSETPSAPADVGEIRVYPRDNFRANQATLAHPADQVLALSVEFRQPPDPKAMTYEIDLTGAKMQTEPFRGQDAHIWIESPLSPPGSGPSQEPDWMAHGMARTENEFLDNKHDPGPRHSDPDLLTSARVEGNVAEFALDTTDQSEFLGDGPVRPTIRIIAFPRAIPSPDGPFVAPYQQYCRWDTAVTDQSAPRAETTSPPTVAAPQPRAVPAPGIGGLGPPSQAQTVPTPNPGVLEFQSPTGNIVCNMGPTGAACEIREHDYPVPAPPPNCVEYGDRFAMDIGGGGAMVCHMGNFFGQPLPTQAYDTPLTAGTITCVVNEQTGVTCRDTSTGHFFQVSKQSYQVG
jgi:hypothetical protein